MPWCPRCGTGISQHEMHEGYKEVIHDSAFLKFPIRNRHKEAFLVWTTTPWTLLSNVAVAVHPDIDYVKVKQEEWIFYLAEALAMDEWRNDIIAIAQQAKWIPADLVLECFPGQFRNWFYSLLAMSTMMENVPPFKTLVGHALVNDEQGEEMHKSKGNAILFEEAADKMGCDVMRWIFFRQDMSRNLSFGYSIAKEIRGKFFNTLWNTYGFFVNYARLAEWVPPEKPTPVKTRPDFDRWIISDLQLLIEYSHQAYQKYDLKRLVIAAEEFLESLSNGYVRHNRNRFWKVGNEKDSAMAFETLYDCLFSFIRIVAPMIPFITEEIYQNMVKSHDLQAPGSVHHTEFPVVNHAVIDKELTNEMEAIMRIIGLGHSARERAGTKIRQPLSRLTVSCSNRIEKQAVKRFTDTLKTFLNVKDVEVPEQGAPKPNIPVTYTAKPNFKVISKKIGKKTQALKSYSNEHKDELLCVQIKQGNIDSNGANVKLGDLGVNILIKKA